MSNFIINTLLIINSINTYRSNHCTPLLQYDLDIENIANKSAILLSNDTNFNNKYINSENIALIDDNNENNDKTYAVIAAINLFYNQYNNYNYSNPQFNYNTSCFTQLLWASTAKCGVGISNNNKNKLIIVIKFSKAGNIENEYNINVLLPCVQEYFPLKKYSPIPSPIRGLSRKLYPKYPPYPPYPPYIYKNKKINRKLIKIIS